MVVRFKGQTEYQKSFGVVPPYVMAAESCPPLAGRPSHAAATREPELQRLRRIQPRLLDLQSSGKLSHATTEAPLPVVNRKESHLDPRTSQPGPTAEPGPTAGPGATVGPGPTPELIAGTGPRAESGPTPGPTVGPEPTTHDSEPAIKSEPADPEPGSRVRSDKPRPSSSHQTVALPPELHPHRARLRVRGQRLGGHRSEYNRKFSWKEPEETTASPVLTAQQVFFSSRSVPPFQNKNHIQNLQSEYQRSFLPLALPARPLPWKHLNPQNQGRKKKREESQKKPHPKQDVPGREDRKWPTPSKLRTEYQSSFHSPLYRDPQGDGAKEGHTHQVRELRQQARSYKTRAWGTNFSRDHLSQLLSDNNFLWEVASTDPPTDPPTLPRPPQPSPRPGSPGDPDLDLEDLELDLARSTQSCSRGSEGNKKIQTSPEPPAEPRRAWREGEEEEEEEGRQPTPHLKKRPVQRTHHDLTTPATGGAMLVGLQKNSDWSLSKQRCSSAVSMATKVEPVACTPVDQMEAWSENLQAPSTSVSKPIRTKQRASPPVALPPQHGLQGTLRHPDFQHNGDLGLRFRELLFSSNGSDEDERLSVMSWHSAASCSMASAVLERALKRREEMWGTGS